MSGPRELRGLIKWREKIRAFIDQSDTLGDRGTQSESEGSCEGESELKLMNMELSCEKRRKRKKERRDCLKRRLKLAESLKMFPGGTEDMAHSDVPLFNINTIRNQQQVSSYWN